MMTRGSALELAPDRKGRICSRCGTKLIKADGSVDYKRRFCGSDCKKADLKERRREQRKRIEGRKCWLCGRKSSGDMRYEPSVSRDTPADLNAIDWHSQEAKRALRGF